MNKVRMKIVWITLFSIISILFFHYLLKTATESHIISVEKTGFDIDNMNLEMELLAYKHATLGFSEIDIDALNKKIDNQEQFFLFTGRITCQWCRIVAPKLRSVIERKEIEMYYLNSEETEQNEMLSRFRDKYKITTVPSVIFFAGSSEYFPLELDLSETGVLNIEKSIENQIDYALEQH